MNARFAVFEGSGRPIIFKECDLPKLGEGETLIKIHCCALCRSDLHTFAGRRNEPTPTILGHEAVGEVVESKAGFNPGTRVTWSIYAACEECFFCSRGLPQKCANLFKYGHSQISESQPLSGGLATHILLRKGTQLLETPPDVPDAIAALANCSTATACAAIRSAELAENSFVAVFGAGILGLTCAAVLASQGHQVFIFEPDEVKRELAADFGCIGFESDIQRFTARTSTLTSSRGADAVLELSGSLSAARSCLELARIGGTVVWVGTVSPVGELAISPERVVRRQVTIKGVHNYSPQDLQAACNFLVENHSRYPFETLIGEKIPLGDIQTAFVRAENSAQRIIVQP